MKTTFRHIPTGYNEKISHPDYGIECFFSNEMLSAIFYCGKSNKPLFHYKFKTVERMMFVINEKINNIKANVDSKNIKKAKAKELNSTLQAKNHFYIGEVILNSWGWEQTNIEFYQVVGLKNKQIIVRELAQKIDSVVGFMSENVVPIIDKFISDEITLKIKYVCWSEIPQVIICNPKPFYYFHKWDGKPKYQSHYA